jgi:hypothetical protein
VPTMAFLPPVAIGVAAASHHALCGVVLAVLGLGSLQIGYLVGAGSLMLPCRRSSAAFVAACCGSHIRFATPLIG